MPYPSFRRLFDRTGNAGRALGVAGAILAVTLFIWLVWPQTQYPSSQVAQPIQGAEGIDPALRLAHWIAAPAFIGTYIVFLIFVTVGVVYYCKVAFSRERNATKEILEMLGQLRNKNVTADALIIRLNRYTDARINTIEACLRNPPEPAIRNEVRKSGIRGATGIFLGLMAATPSARHLQDVIRPSEGVLRSEFRRTFPRPAAASPIITWLGLIGTFLGLIAALTIASRAIPSGSGGPDQMATLLSAITTLLQTAAVKFWISASALFLALLLRIWQLRLDAQANGLIHELGHALDDALSRPDVVAVWCIATDASLDPIARKLAGISDQIAISARQWTLAMPDFVEMIAATVRKSHRQLRLELDTDALQPLGDQIDSTVRNIAREYMNHPAQLDQQFHRMGVELEKIGLVLRALLDEQKRTADLLRYARGSDDDRETASSGFGGIVTTLSALLEEQRRMTGLMKAAWIPNVADRPVLVDAGPTVK